MVGIPTGCGDVAAERIIGVAHSVGGSAMKRKSDM
jgi:hypothetical protein